MRTDGSSPLTRGAPPDQTPEKFSHGSSPLTRGALWERDAVGPGDGLIPAHAGSTY